MSTTARKACRRAGLIAFLVATVFVLTLFVVTRPFFIRTVVLPRLSSALDIPVVAETVRVSPSSLRADGIRVGPHATPLLRADKVSVSYRPLRTLLGHTRVERVALEGLSIHLIRDQHGGINLPAIRDDDDDDDQDDDQDDADEPENLLIEQVSASGLAIAFTQMAGEHQAPLDVRLSQIDLDMHHLGSDAEGTVSLQGRLDRFHGGEIADAQGIMVADGRVRWDAFMNLVALDLDATLSFSKGTAHGLPLAGRELSLRLRLKGTVFEASLRTRNMQRMDEQDEPLPSWDAALAVSGDRQGEHTKVESATFSLLTDAGPVAAVSASGAFSGAPFSGRSQWTVNAERLDLDRLMRLLRPEDDGSNRHGSRASVDDSGKPSQSQEPGPWSTGAAESVADVRLQNLTYRGLPADVACKVTLRQSVLTLEAIEGRIAENAVSGALTADLSVPGLRYEGEVQVGAGPLQPYIATWAPELSDQLRAALSDTTVRFSGQGMTHASLSRHLQATVQTGLQQVTVEGLDGQADLARRWAVPELQRITIDRAVVEAHLADGQAVLDTVRESGPDHRLEVDGTVGLDGSLDLELIFGVAGALRQRLVTHPAFRDLTRYFKEEGDYLVVPVPIPVRGSVDDPSFDKDAFFRQLGALSVDAAVRDLIRRGLQDDTENATAPSSQAADPAPAGPAHAILDELRGRSNERSDSQTLTDADVDNTGESAKVKRRAESDQPDAVGGTGKQMMTPDQREHQRNEARRRKRNEAAADLLRSLLGP